MVARNGLRERLSAALEMRPAIPGLLVVAVLLVAALSGWTVTSVAWFWPAATALLLVAVVLNTVRQDFWRRVQAHDHQQRMDVAHTMLNDHPHQVEPEEQITGTIRDLGGVVERFGLKLDDLLAEVHAESRPAGARSPEQRQHRS